MLEELTKEYNIENWKEATKNWNFIMYSTETLGNITNTLNICDFSSVDNGPERDSKINSNINSKIDIPIGENIRDAIRSITRK